MPCHPDVSLVKLMSRCRDWGEQAARATGTWASTRQEETGGAKSEAGGEAPSARAMGPVNGGEGRAGGSSRRDPWMGIDCWARFTNGPST